MAYKEKDLVTDWINPVRIPNGNNVNLLTVQGAIQNQANYNGIPVAFGQDQLKVGGFLSSQLEDVLIMYNPQHPNDYLKFLIRLQHMGNYAFMHIYNLGGSKNYRDNNVAAQGGAFGTLRKIGNAFGGHNQKLQQEEQYYLILKDCLENILN